MPGRYDRIAVRTLILFDGTTESLLAFFMRVRQTAAAFGSRKVRTPKGRMLGNSQAGRPDGQCNREQTADGRRDLTPDGTGEGETVV